MKSSATLAIGCLALVSLASATAHPLFYVQGGTGDSVGLDLDCGPPHVWPPDPTPDGIGAVCFDAWHIGHDADGDAWVWISDVVTYPTSGYVCQDANSDSLCGGSFGELGEAFCGVTELGNGDGWVYWARTWVFIDGPLLGNPLFSACFTTSAGTMGRVWHDP